MTKRSTIKVIPKKRGRPATGKDPLIALRLPPELIERVDEWASDNGDVSRSAAIRQFIEAGLAVAPKRGRTK